MTAPTQNLNDELIDEAVARYWREHDRYVKLATRVNEICRALVTENTIRAQVSFRVKAPDRLSGKLRKYMAKPGEASHLTTPEAIFKRVGDLAGVRITTYEERDRATVATLLAETFHGPDDANEPSVEEKNKHDQDRANFYRATHCQVVLPPDQLVGIYENLKGLSCEVQVCSMLAHVWNEVEHDLKYKPFAGTLSEEEEDLIQQLGHLTMAGDSTIRLLVAAVERRQQSETGPFADEFDFVARLRGKYPLLPDFSRNAQTLYGELLSRQLDSPEKVLAHFEHRDIPALQADVIAFDKWLVENTGREPGYVTPTGADTLLLALFEESAQTVMRRHPAGPGLGRPPRIAWLARRYIRMKQMEASLDAPADDLATGVPVSFSTVSAATAAAADGSEVE